MNRTRALTLPSFAAWAVALAVAASIILAALSLGNPRFLLYGFGAVLLVGGLVLLALRQGTGGWLAAGLLLLAGLLPYRVFILWQPKLLGGAFNLVIAATLALGGLAWLGRMLTQRAGKANGVALPQVLLFVLALAGILLKSPEYFSVDRPLRALLWMFVPMVAFWIVASSRISRREALLLTRVMLGVGAMMALLGLRFPLQLWHAKSAGFLFGSHTAAAFRTITPVGGPGLSAMILGMMLPVALALAMEDGRWWRRLWTFCALLFVVAIAFSINRTGIIACICSLVFFGWLNRRVLRRRMLVVALTVAVAAGLVTVAVLNYRHYTNFTRVTRFLDADNSSDRLRITTARAAFEVGSNRPVLGSGLGRFYPRDVGPVVLVEGIPTARDPHSLYLLALAEMGVPGLVLVLWLVCRPMLDFLRERRRADFRRALLLSAFAASLLAMDVYSIMSCAVFVHFQVATVAWWTVGLGYQFVQTRPETTSE